MRLGPEVRSQSQTWLRVPKLESHPEVPRDSVGGPTGGAGIFFFSPQGFYRQLGHRTSP